MSCSVPGCTNTRRFKPKGVSFHRFPQDELIEDWLEILYNDPIKSWVWSANKVVCSFHFRPEDFINIGNRRMLKINAVPSILPKKRRFHSVERFVNPEHTVIPTTSKNIAPQNTLAQFIDQDRSLLNVNLSLSQTKIKKDEYFIEPLRCNDDTTKSATDIESSVVHFVIKSETFQKESKAASPERTWKKEGTQWNCIKDFKICSIDDVKANGSQQAGYNSILSSLLSSASESATTSTTNDSHIFTSSTTVKPKYAYVNAKVANQKIHSFKKVDEENDPLALETCPSSVSFVHPQPKRAPNTVKIKAIKNILLRKPQKVDVAVATNPTRNELKANAHMKRLTGLSLPFFTELLSLLKKDDQPRYKKLPRDQLLLLFLVKMKWGLSFVMLASHFPINSFYATIIFTDVLDSLYNISQQWLVLCAKATKSSPGLCSRFKVIIDCFEVLIEGPRNFEDDSFSSINTKRDSYKFLLGVAPTGSVSFVSKTQRGDASKGVVLKGTCSSWLSCVQAGDLVAIGRGCFELESALKEIGAVPVPFDTQEGVVDTEELAACRRRFERTVQKLKTFEILKLITLEVSDLKLKKFEILNIDAPGHSVQIDKIVHVCCVLLNHKLLKPNRRKSGIH